MEAIGTEWATTEDVAKTIGAPAPSREQIRKTLTGLADQGRIERDPPIEEGVARGKTHLWRASSAKGVNGE